MLPRNILFVDHGIGLLAVITSHGGFFLSLTGKLLFKTLHRTIKYMSKLMVYVCVHVSVCVFVC